MMNAPRGRIRWGPTPGRRQRPFWPLLVVVLLLIPTGWLLYDNFGPFGTFSPATTSFSSVSDGLDWPMSQRSPSRNALVPIDSWVPKREVIWTFKADASTPASPAVVGGTVYLPTGDGRLVSLDAATGELLWEFASTGPVRSSPAVAGELAYVGLDDGRIVALDRDTGRLRWQFETGEQVLSSPVIHEGVLYVGSNDWYLYALDAATGERIWRFKASNAITSDPSVYPPVIAFVDLHGRLHVLDIDNAKVRFHYETAITAEGGPVFQGNRVFVADGGGRVRAVDWSEWSRPFEELYVRVRRQAWLWRLVESVGQQRGIVWYSRERAGAFDTAPVVAGGMVFAASLSGSLFALERDTGARIWEFKADHAFEASPLVVGDTVVAGDAGGDLYGVNALTGELEWEVGFDSGIATTPVFAGGAFYVGTKDGTFYALE